MLRFLGRDYFERMVREGAQRLAIRSPLGYSTHESTISRSLEQLNRQSSSPKSPRKPVTRSTSPPPPSGLTIKRHGHAPSPGHTKIRKRLDLPNLDTSSHLQQHNNQSTTSGWGRRPMVGSHSINLPSPPKHHKGGGTAKKGGRIDLSKTGFDRLESGTVSGRQKETFSKLLNLISTDFSSETEEDEEDEDGSRRMNQI